MFEKSDAAGVTPLRYILPRCSLAILTSFVGVGHPVQLPKRWLYPLVPLTLLLSRPPLAAKPEISDHLPKAPDPLCGAMFVRREGACDHLPLSCTFFFFCTPCPLWAFCRMTVLPYFGHKRLNTAFWARLVWVATFLREAAHGALQGQQWGIWAAGPERPPNPAAF